MPCLCCTPVGAGITSRARQGSRRARQERVKPLLAVRSDGYDGRMADVWVLLAVAAFFGLCVAFVSGCDRIIGPDIVPVASDESVASTDPIELVA